MTKPNATVNEIRLKIEAARARLESRNIDKVMRHAANYGTGAKTFVKTYHKEQGRTWEQGPTTGRELSSKFAYEQHLRNTTNKLPVNSGAHCGFLDGEQK